MLPHIRRYRPALAAAAFAAILVGGAVAAPAAFADPPGVNVVQTTQGVAGYFANDNGMTRFRDVQADTTVTNQVKNLDGTNNTTNPGGVGVELCDPNSGIAAQLGLEWDGANFVVKYGEGNLGNTTTSDPCVMTGLITNPTPQQLLTNFHISAGDHLHFEIFWQPHGFHFFKFNVCDTTLDVCRQAIVHTGFLNLYEAGIGAVTNSVTLTAPPVNPLVTFTGTKFNYYSSTTAWNSIFVPSHWKLDRADFVNNSDQPVMSSNGGLNTAGTTFPLLEGSTSAGPRR